MGYTTKFKGQFQFNKPLPAEVVLLLMDLYEDSSDERFEAGPGGYCQWILTKGRDGLQWDGEEKFYDYVEWLQFIINRILHTHGIELTGSVAYSGEESTDNGVIRVEDGVAIKSENGDAAATITDLQEFKDFAVKWDSDNEGELVRAWSEHKGLAF